jgi:hypothetical protein
MTQSHKHFSQQADFRLQPPRLFAAAKGSAIAENQAKLLIPLALRPMDSQVPRGSLMAIHLHRGTGELTTRANVLEFDPRYDAVTLEGRLGHAYNEGVFQHLLSVEFKRSQRSKRPFRLLLMDLKEQPGTNRDIAPEVAAKLFSCLARCLRETDFVGWYRVGRVVGAVLTHFQDGIGLESSQVVGQRVREALRGSLPASVLDRLKICSHQRPPSHKGRD